MANDLEDDLLKITTACSDLNLNELCRSCGKCQKTVYNLFPNKSEETNQNPNSNSNQNSNENENISSAKNNISNNNNNNNSCNNNNNNNNHNNNSNNDSCGEETYQKIKTKSQDPIEKVVHQGQHNMYQILQEMNIWQLGISEGDGLSQFICTKCTAQFYTIHKFRKKCVKVQLKLRQITEELETNTNEKLAILMEEYKNILLPSEERSRTINPPPLSEESQRRLQQISLVGTNKNQGFEAFKFWERTSQDTTDSKLNTKPNSFLNCSVEINKSFPSLPERTNQSLDKTLEKKCKDDTLTKVAISQKSLETKIKTKAARKDYSMTSPFKRKPKKFNKFIFKKSKVQRSNAKRATAKIAVECLNSPACASAAASGVGTGSGISSGTLVVVDDGVAGAGAGAPAVTQVSHNDDNKLTNLPPLTEKGNNQNLVKVEATKPNESDKQANNSTKFNNLRYLHLRRKIIRRKSTSRNKATSRPSINNPLPLEKVEESLPQSAAETNQSRLTPSNEANEIHQEFDGPKSSRHIDQINEAPLHCTRKMNRRNKSPARNEKETNLSRLRPRRQAKTTSTHHMIKRRQNHPASTGNTDPDHNDSPARNCIACPLNRHRSNVKGEKSSESTDNSLPSTPSNESSDIIPHNSEEEKRNDLVPSLTAPSSQPKDSVEGFKETLPNLQFIIKVPLSTLSPEFRKKTFSQTLCENKNENTLQANESFVDSKQSEEKLQKETSCSENLQKSSDETFMNAKDSFSKKTEGSSQVSKEESVVSTSKASKAFEENEENSTYSVTRGPNILTLSIKKNKSSEKPDEKNPISPKKKTLSEPKKDDLTPENERISPSVHLEDKEESLDFDGKENLAVENNSNFNSEEERSKRVSSNLVNFSEKCPSTDLDQKIKRRKSCNIEVYNRNLSLFNNKVNDEKYFDFTQEGPSVQINYVHSTFSQKSSQNNSGTKKQRRSSVDNGLIMFSKNKRPFEEGDEKDLEPSNCKKQTNFEDKTSEIIEQNASGGPVDPNYCKISSTNLSSSLSLQTKPSNQETNLSDNQVKPPHTSSTDSSEKAFNENQTSTKTYDSGIPSSPQYATQSTDTKTSNSAAEQSETPVFASLLTKENSNEETFFRPQSYERSPAIIGSSGLSYMDIDASPVFSIDSPHPQATASLRTQNTFEGFDGSSPYMTSPNNYDCDSDKLPAVCSNKINDFLQEFNKQCFQDGDYDSDSKTSERPNEDLQQSLSKTPGHILDHEIQDVETTINGILDEIQDQHIYTPVSNHTDDFFNHSVYSSPFLDPHDTPNSPCTNSVSSAQCYSASNASSPFIQHPQESLSHQKPNFDKPLDSFKECFQKPNQQAANELIGYQNDMPCFESFEINYEQQQAAAKHVYGPDFLPPANKSLPPTNNPIGVIDKSKQISHNQNQGSINEPNFNEETNMQLTQLINEFEQVTSNSSRQRETHITTSVPVTNNLPSSQFSHNTLTSSLESPLTIPQQNHVPQSPHMVSNPATPAHVPQWAHHSDTNESYGSTAYIVNDSEYYSSSVMPSSVASVPNSNLQSNPNVCYSPHPSLTDTSKNLAPPINKNFYEASSPHIPPPSPYMIVIPQEYLQTAHPSPGIQPQTIYNPQMDRHLTSPVTNTKTLLYEAAVQAHNTSLVNKDNGKFGSIALQPTDKRRQIAAPAPAGNVVNLICRFCHKRLRFTNNYDYSNHIISTHPVENPFNCPYCPTFFTRRHKREKHILENHSSNRFQCAQCDQIFSAQRGLDTHLQKAHAPKQPKMLKPPQVPIQHPPQQFVPNNMMLADDMVYVEEVRLDMTNELKEKRAIHLGFETGETTQNPSAPDKNSRILCCPDCDDCSKNGYSSQKHCSNHQASNNQNQMAFMPSPVQVEPDSTSTAMSLRQYRKRRNSQNNNESHVPINASSGNMNKEFLSKSIPLPASNISDNSRTSKTTGDRYVLAGCHNCLFCEDSFTNESLLKKHHQLAHGNQPSMPYTCSVCKRGFRMRSALQRHMEAHEVQGRPYECDLCHVRFPRPSQLTLHKLSVHYTKKPFSCNECGKNFVTETILRTHMKFHGGI